MWCQENNLVILLGATAGDKSTLNYYISNLCGSTNYKLNALYGIRKYLTLGQSKFLCIQFNHCRIIWMFCRKKQYSKHQKMHYKALILSLYGKIRFRENAHSGIVYAFCRILFLKNITYSISNGTFLKLPNANSTDSGINFILVRACLLWNSLS